LGEDARERASSVKGMRIVFLTNEKFDSDEIFRYMFAYVAASFPDVHIVAVRRSQAENKPFLPRLQEKVRKLLWRARRFGFVHVFEVLSSQQLRRLAFRRFWQEVDEIVVALPRPPVQLQPEKALYVETVNGPETVEAISGLEPEVVIQFHAGILQEQVFEIARIGTLNLHPGIAPLIKGQDPIQWALWERRRGWLGATVHYIDEGIDTGPVLAYAPVEPRYPGERVAPLYVRIIEVGVEHLLEALRRLAREERWTIRPPQGERVYRTVFSGWRLLLLEIRLALQRGKHYAWTTVKSICNSLGAHVSSADQNVTLPRSPDVRHRNRFWRWFSYSRHLQRSTSSTKINRLHR
jgi:folate-dependent phosphoribosylglycinamide formyltransferase PurN